MMLKTLLKTMLDSRYTVNDRTHNGKEGSYYDYMVDYGRTEEDKDYGCFLCCRTKNSIPDCVMIKTVLYVSYNKAEECINIKVE